MKRVLSASEMQWIQRHLADRFIDPRPESGIRVGYGKMKIVPQREAALFWMDRAGVPKSLMEWILDLTDQPKDDMVTT